MKKPPKITKYDLVTLTNPATSEQIVLLFALGSNGVLYQSLNGILTPLPIATKAATREPQRTLAVVPPTDGARALT